MKVNGLNIDAYFTESEIESIFLPLLDRWTDIQMRLGRRIIIFLAAPPGCGKSTLSLFLQELSKDRSDITPLQTIGLDGFHYPADYLKTHMTDDGSCPLELIKGAPETFDVEYLKIKLKETLTGNTKWPVYDRIIHDVIPDKIRTTEPIILLEGNYLLLDEPPWSELYPYCDDSIFLTSDPEILRERLTDRKIRGGSTMEAAVSHVENVDMPNVKLVMEHSRKASVCLISDQDYSFRIKV